MFPQVLGLGFARSVSKPTGYRIAPALDQRFTENVSIFNNAYFLLALLLLIPLLINTARSIDRE